MCHRSIRSTITISMESNYTANFMIILLKVSLGIFSLLLLSLPLQLRYVYVYAYRWANCDLVTIYCIWNWWMGGHSNWHQTWTIKLECNSFICWFAFGLTQFVGCFANNLIIILKDVVLTGVRAHTLGTLVAPHLIGKGWRFYISNSYWMSNRLKFNSLRIVKWRELSCHRMDAFRCNTRFQYSINHLPSFYQICDILAAN